MATGTPTAPLRLLVCVTGSPHAPSVVRGALGLKEALRAELVYLHVGPDSAETRRDLDRVFEEAGVGPRPEALLVRDGRPDEVIGATAAERGIDVVCIGALERESVVRELLGSTARRVARRAPCSVLLLVGAVEPAEWRSLVASVQYDEASAEMLRRLVLLARAVPGAQLHVVHETEPAGAGLAEAIEGGAAGAGRARSLRAAAESYRLADFLESVDLGAVRVTAACLAGRAGAELVRYAVEVGADLIATTAPARHLGVWDRFFGHPAETVLHRLPCSLLVHRSRER